VWSRQASGTPEHHQCFPLFDEETILKLDLFENYLTSWLGFSVLRQTKLLILFYYFCGPGQDCSGIPGSPLGIIETVEKFTPKFKERNSNINFIQ
jgi:hypothetical protein